MQKIIHNGNTYWKPDRPLRFNNGGDGPNLFVRMPVEAAKEIRRLDGKLTYKLNDPVEHYDFSTLGSLTVSFTDNGGYMQPMWLAPANQKVAIERGFRPVLVGGKPDIELLPVTRSSGGCVIVPTVGKTKRRYKNATKTFRNPFTGSVVIDDGTVSRKYSKKMRKARTKAQRIFSTAVFAQANGRTLFTDITQYELGFAANHIIDYGGKTPLREAMDANNGFVDLKTVGDWVQYGILSIDNTGRIVAMPGFETLLLSLGVKFRTVLLSPEQAAYWARHYKNTFGKRK